MIVHLTKEEIECIVLCVRDMTYQAQTEGFKKALQSIELKLKKYIDN